MSTNSSDPLHGITIIPQAMEGTYSDAQPFQANFTDALQPFGEAASAHPHASRCSCHSH